ncbi:hypothetical protein N0V93_007591 [Gnomoniopsis smithogilvyi]|uniref:Microbial-type PARG catalytic domain-containing protein n=1 Tax=Gnomoniopsis smithogilvyi TaxID=1191159 RepID=A0A9W8YTY9_9PEZI|nr:hypothetical protein N0V93_007591 [Gnomoniopsis smithogilvyi]
MASPLSPGGGFVNGATSQEEQLCMRTTLLPALKDEFYRLPEVGCVYTPDVLVFRSGDTDGQDGVLDKNDRWFVDVVSAAMLRLPETQVDEETGRGEYVQAKDRELVILKMKTVMEVLQAKGIAKVVLGAWGCGAYGNPVGEIARAWRKVLVGDKERKDKKKKFNAMGQSCYGLDEVVFAIKDHGMAEAFQSAYGQGLSWVDEAVYETDHDDGEDTVEEEQGQYRELVSKMDELRIRIDRTANPQVKEGLQAVMAGLQRQLPGENEQEDSQEDEDDNMLADHIQIVDDNPCVPNSIRFESVPARLDPLPDLIPIPKVNINDKLELKLMASFRMTASKEEVTLAISPRRQEQYAVAVPLCLGLKWYTRSAKLNVIIEKPQVADRVDENLTWIQWTLSSLSGAFRTDQPKFSAKHSHHDRSLVVVQAGGSPLCIGHIEALTMHLEQHQITSRYRSRISKEGFQKHFTETYINKSDALASPFNLETGFPENMVEDDANEMMALVAETREIQERMLHMSVTIVEVLLQILIQTYENKQQVLKTIETLVPHCNSEESVERYAGEGGV